MPEAPNKIIIGNGAGTCKTIEEFQKLLASEIDIITIGSITANSRIGNQGKIFYNDAKTGSCLNAYGMPNRGAEYYGTVLSDWKKQAKKHNKKLSVSIAPLIIKEDIIPLITTCVYSDVDYIEINTGCPNVYKDQVADKPLAFLFEELELVLTETMKIVPDYIKVRIKLPPIPVELQDTISDMIKKYSTSQKIEVVTSNTIPRDSWLDSDDGEVLSYMSPDSSDPKKTHHTGGISGAGICFETNLEQTKAFGKKLPGHNIIGLGGISTREHVDLYLQAGATSIQICSAYLINKDSNIFKNIRK